MSHIQNLTAAIYWLFFFTGLASDSPSCDVAVHNLFRYSWNPATKLIIYPTAAYSTEESYFIPSRALVESLRTPTTAANPQSVKGRILATVQFFFEAGSHSVTFTVYHSGAQSDAVIYCRGSFCNGVVGKFKNYWNPTTGEVSCLKPNINGKFYSLFAVPNGIVLELSNKSQLSLINGHQIMADLLITTSTQQLQWVASSVRVQGNKVMFYSSSSSLAAVVDLPSSASPISIAFLESVTALLGDRLIFHDLPPNNFDLETARSNSA